MISSGPSDKLVTEELLVLRPVLASGRGGRSSRGEEAQLLGGDGCGVTDLEPCARSTLHRADPGKLPGRGERRVFEWACSLISDSDRRAMAATLLTVRPLEIEWR